MVLGLVKPLGFLLLLELSMVVAFEVQDSVLHELLLLPDTFRLFLDLVKLQRVGGLVLLFLVLRYTHGINLNN